MFSCEYCEILENSFFYRTPPAVGASSFMVFLVFIEREYLGEIG